MYDELVKRLREHNGWALNETLDEAADAIEQLSKLALDEHNRAAVAAWEHRWIPVSERLPEASGHYLIFLECKYDGELLSAWMQVAWFCEKFYWEHLHSEDVFKETITHWMPLPSTEGLNET